MATDVLTEVIKFQAVPKDVEVEYRTDSFRPNKVSNAFARTISKDLTGLVVDDIGSGGGVLAIIEASRGAREVRAVEPADANYELLVRNIRRNGYEGTIKAFKGEFFNPIQNFSKADVISADVSGIPEIFARALGWYPQGIPTGGSKGTEITCELLRRAPYYLKQNGKLYFPTANDLLDANEILQVAKENFEFVENALCSQEQLAQWKTEAEASNGKMWKSPDFEWFYLTSNDMKKLETAYGGKIPSTINLQTVRNRMFWRGQLYVAYGPKVNRFESSD